MFFLKEGGKILENQPRNVWNELSKYCFDIRENENPNIHSTQVKKSIENNKVPFVYFLIFSGWFDKFSLYAFRIF